MDAGEAESEGSPGMTGDSSVGLVSPSSWRHKHEDEEEPEIDKDRCWSSGLDDPPTAAHDDGRQGAETDLGQTGEAEEYRSPAERAMERELNKLHAINADSILRRSREILGRVMEDPFIKNKKVILLKAWMKWAKMLPLNLKCDELAKQLKERLTAFISLRDSYYRDVVSIKLHLTKVHDYALDTKARASQEPGTPGESGAMGAAEMKAAKQLQADLYSVHALPSVNFQSLVERACRTDESSVAMRQNLLQAGLLNVATGKAFNPWEKGKSFGKIMKQNKGAHYRLPVTEGESVSAASPSTHELFIKYCKQCVGIMQFTRTWNQEVEEAMRLKSVTNYMGKEISDLKFTIGQLNKIISDQEMQVMQVTETNKRLKEAATWMKAWTYQKETETREGELHLQIKLEAERQSMLVTDLESTVLVVQERREADKGKGLLREAKLNQRLIREQESKEEERNLRMAMHEALSLSEAAGQDKDQDIVALRAETKEQKEALFSARAAIASLSQTVEEQTVALAAGTERYNSLLTISQETKEQLDYEKSIVQSELGEKLELLDNLLEQKRDDVAKINRLQARCDIFDVQEAKEAAHRAYLALRPKHSMRVIAIVVRTAVRLSRAIAAGPPFYGAGALGRRKAEICLHLSYVPALEELKACRERGVGLEGDLVEARKEISALTYKGNEARATLAITREANKTLQGTLDDQRKQIKEQAAASGAQIADLKLQILTLLDKIPQLKRVSHRHRVASHLQRILTRHLCRSLTQLQAVIRTSFPEALVVLPPSILEKDRIAAGIELDPLVAAARAEASALEVPPEEAIPPDENPARAKEIQAEAAAVAKKMRQQELRSKFRSAFITLVKWLQKAKKERPLEGADFRLPHAYAESGEATVPLHDTDFEALFRRTSKDMRANFLEERRRVHRQTEQALVDAQHASTFASTARHVLARTNAWAEALQAELLECRRCIQDWEVREDKRLKKEAKEKKRAEAKALKQQEKLAAMQAKRDSSKKTNPSSKASAKTGAAAAEDDDGSVVSHGSNAPAAQAKNPGYMSLDARHQSAGGVVPGGKAKVEVDLSFLDKPERAPSVKRPVAAKSVMDDGENDESDEEEEEEEAEESFGVPNAELEMIDQLEEELQALQLEKNGLLAQLDQARSREEGLHAHVAQLESSIQVLAADLRLSRLDFDAAKDRIRLLRDAIEDNYRQRTIEMEGIRKEVAEKERREVKSKRAARRHRGTQIACSVCAIRASETSHDADNVGEHASLCSGVSVVENLVEAVGGDFVLVARARTITNSKSNRARTITDSDHKRAAMLPAHYTTYFSDAPSNQLDGSEESRAHADPVLAAQMAQARELAQHFSQSRDKATMSSYYQKKASRTPGAANPNPRPSSKPDRLSYGAAPIPVTDEPPGAAQRPSTADAKMYESAQGYRHAHGHTLDDDNLGSMHYVGSIAAGNPGLGKGPTSTEGIRSRHEVRKIETNTSAFLQRQLVENLDNPGRLRSSIPSIRAPAPPLDGAVHKRQLAAVPMRSQSATELINHLRRTVAPSLSGSQNQAGQAAPPVKAKQQQEEGIKWKLSDGNFEWHSGMSFYEAEVEQAQAPDASTLPGSAGGAGFLTAEVELDLEEGSITDDQICMEHHQ